MRSRKWSCDVGDRNVDTDRAKHCHRCRRWTGGNIYGAAPLFVVSGNGLWGTWSSQKSFHRQRRMWRGLGHRSVA